MVQESIMTNSARVVTDSKVVHGTSPSPAKVTCDHCGVLHTEVRRWEGRYFCCPGCEGAFRLIHGLGFAKYYELRDREVPGSTRPVTGKIEGFEALDDPKVLSQFGEEVGDTIVVEALLEGVHCAACIWLLERLPEIHRGVISARLDYGRSTLKLAFDPKATKLSAVASVLAMLGYRPRMLSAENREAEASRSRRLAALRMGVAGFSSLNTMMMAVSLYQGNFTGIENHYRHFLGWASLVVSLPAMFFSARPIVESAWSSIRARRIHVDLPLALAIVGGFLGSTVNVLLGNPEIYFDSVTALIFLLLVSRWFQQEMIRRVTSSSVFVPSLDSQIVNRVLGESVVPTHLLLIKRGDTLSLNGECVIPVDGTLVKGEGHVDLSSLTGETVSRIVGVGDRVFAGSRWLEGSAHLSVDALGEETRIGKVVVSGRVKEAYSHVALLDRVGTLFVSAVLCGIMAAALLHWGDPLRVAEAVLSLLIVSCPCAIAIGAPLAFARALSSASAEGILIKGVQTLERLTSVTHVFVDKTGTLTRGDHSVLRVCVWDSVAEKWAPISVAQTSALATVVSGLESSSSHPVGRALFRWASNEASAESHIVTQAEHASNGILGTMDGVVWCVGSESFLRSRSIFLTVPMRASLIHGLTPGHSVVFATDAGISVFAFTLGDSINSAAAGSIGQLQALGLSVEMLSGDRQDVVDAVARKLLIPQALAHGELLPEEKLRRVTSQSKRSLMVGDGINDAPSLRAAYVGVAVSGGAEVSLQEADVYCAKGGFSDVPRVIRGAQRTFARLRLSLVVSLLYNSVAGVLAIAGEISPLLAAVIMPISSLTAIGIVMWGREYFSEDEG